MTSHHRSKSSFLNTTHRLYPHKKRVQKGRKKNNLKTSYCFNHYCYHCCSGLDAPLFKHKRINLLNIDTSQPTFLLFCSLSCPLVQPTQNWIISTIFVHRIKRNIQAITIPTTSIHIKAINDAFN